MKKHLPSLQTNLPLGLIRDSLQAPFLFKFNKMFDEFFNSSFPEFNLCKSIDSNSYPKCDIIEYTDRLQMQFEIPGMKKQDINITISNGMLSISGQKRQQNQKKKQGEYIKREIKRSKFSRSFDITNQQLDIQKLSAAFQNNILTIIIPKKEQLIQKPETKTIEIK